MAKLSPKELKKWEASRDLVAELERSVREMTAGKGQLQRDIQEGLDSGSAGKLDVEVIKRRGRARLDAAKTSRDKR
jgi:hypothetical protein